MHLKHKLDENTGVKYEWLCVIRKINVYIQSETTQVPRDVRQI